MGLSLVPGNRRKRDRTQEAGSQCLLSVSAIPDIRFPVIIENSNFCTLQLSVDEVLQKILSTVSPNIKMEISQGDDVIVNGQWHINESVSRNGKNFIQLAHSQLQELSPFSNYILPDNVLLTNGFRIISAPNMSSDSEVFGRHLAELKDCPIPVNSHLNLVTGNVSCSAIFDFSSGAKELSQIDFHLDEIPEGIIAKSKVVVNYEFLGARFIFISLISSTDYDFNIISVKIPPSILSLTNRHFNRMNTEIEASLFGKGRGAISSKCKIKGISAKGAEVHFSESHLNSDQIKIGAPISLQVGQDTKIDCIVTNTREGIIGVSFSHTEKNFLPVQSLFVRAASNSLTVRQESNHPDFLELYERVGYGVDVKVKSEWTTQSKHIWRVQDSRLPGNTVGFSDEGVMLVCAGILPMSKHTAVLHSVGVIKEVATLPKALEILNYCHSWLALFSELKTLFICFREKSRFMTRLHISAENQASPERTQIIYCVGYTGIPDVKDSISFRIDEVTSQESLTVSPELFRLSKCLNPAHPKLNDYHQIRMYNLYRDGIKVPAASIFHHTAPHLFTAVDTFRTVFCLLSEPSDNLDEIVNFLGREPRFKDHEICVFSPGNKIHSQFHYSGSMASAPLICYLIADADFPPILGSLHRFIYMTIRKYGEDSFEYLNRVVSSA